ncbi:putative lrr receptor-like serine/threonine-protein kinase, partial [Quercus suber]
INYISDATFIDTGISKSISYELKASYQQQKWTLRSFPDGIRNCYRINITQGVRYLIRATFMHGNYDGQDNNLPEFGLHLGPNMRDMAKIKNASYTVNKELIHVPTLNYIHVCLVNTNLSTLFISAIELRPLNNKTYVTQSGSLALLFCTDQGSLTDRAYSHNDYQLPSVVMSTAAMPKTNSSPLVFNWDSETATSEYYIYMHFAEVVKLKANQYRSFNIILNGQYWYGPVVPKNMSTTTVFSTVAMRIAKQYEVSMIKTENSTLPPIINALEIFSIKNLLQSETDQQDVDAITKIKTTYGVKRNCQGDPCIPQAYLWEGLNCSYDGYNSPRIISLFILLLTYMELSMFPWPNNFYEGIDTPLLIDSQSHNDYQLPSVVMSTAAMPKTNSSPLVFNWDSETATSEYYIYMHFAEVVKLKANQYRSFNIILNGQYWYGPVVPKNMSTTTVFSTVAMRIAKQYEVSMIKTENSTLPPIINALEIFSIKNLLQSETDQQDVDAITKIKSTYGVKRNWQGDPCVPQAYFLIKTTYGVKRNCQGDPCIPQAYLWEGLNCSYDGYNSPRIISFISSEEENTDMGFVLSFR